MSGRDTKRVTYRDKPVTFLKLLALPKKVHVVTAITFK
jgi:hypothetical protein